MLKRIFFLRKSQSRFTFESYPLKKTDFKTKTCPFLIISKIGCLSQSLNRGIKMRCAIAGERGPSEPTPVQELAGKKFLKPSVLSADLTISHRKVKQS